MAGGRVKVALVDDHTLFRTGLRTLLEGDGACEVVGQAADGAELLARLEAGLRPEVVLLDIDMPRVDGFAVAERLAAEYPHIGIVVLSMHGERDYYFRMVALGAKGFLLKNSDFAQVAAAIEAVAGGGTYFSPELLKILSDAAPAPTLDPLTEREIEVLRLICQGLSSQQIAGRLFLSKRTVEAHRANLLEKTGALNTANLVIYAVRRGLIAL